MTDRAPNPPSSYRNPFLGDFAAWAVFLAALELIYKDLDAELGLRNPQCRGCGDCCKFDITRNYLYASGGELMMLAQASPPAPGQLALGRCPYQEGARCLARQGRPLGCRVYFCDRGAAEWSPVLYERFHARIRDLHDRMHLPYEYRELTIALREAMGL